MTERTLSERFGLVHAQSTFVQAAIVASHAVCAPSGGFRASDVRFFFLLFTNWMEHDVLRPDQDLDLTQVRRSLTRLAGVGWAQTAGGAKKASAGEDDDKANRGARHTLTSVGLVGLLESLTNPAQRRPFEELLFMACFAASYRDLIAERVDKEPAGAAVSARRVRELLDPVRILRTARAMLTAVLRDLENRARASVAMTEEARKAREEGATPVQIAERIEKKDAWQLNRIRSMSEMAATLPEDIVRFELGEGMSLRVRMLFEPMAAQVRAQLGVIDALETQLTSGAAKPAGG